MDDPVQDREALRRSHRLWVLRSTGGIAFAALVAFCLCVDLAGSGAVQAQACSPDKADGTGTATPLADNSGELAGDTSFAPSTAQGPSDTTSCAS